MPTEPMLARAIEESDLSTKDWTGWVLEPKHDGMRAIIERTSDGIEIYSRTGKSQKGKCPHLEESLRFLPVGTILDGELAIIDPFGPIMGGKVVPLVNFNKTMRVMGSGAEKAVQRQKEFGLIQFIIFDVIAVGNIVSQFTQEQRNHMRNAIRYNHVRHNPVFTEDFAGVYKQLVEAGVEGAVIKRLDGLYLPGKRSKTWLKVKSEKTFDVVIMGFTNGQGKYEGQIGAIEFGAYHPQDSMLTYVGRCSGMTDEERRYYTDVRDGKVDAPTGVIEVKANEMVGSGEYRTPRHPQYVCARVDKRPQDCLMEQFKA